MRIIVELAEDGHVNVHSGDDQPIQVWTALGILDRAKYLLHNKANEVAQATEPVKN
jgi:hypothetical protein